MAKIKKNVTMADIAARLNVSTVTVSKALSGQKGVSDIVRSQIQEMARELGYEQTKTVKTADDMGGLNIGVLISGRYLEEYASFYWKMYQEIVEYTKTRACYILYESLSQDMEKEKILPRLLEEKKVDGIIVVGRPGYDYDAYLREATAIPLIFLDFYSKDLEVDSFISDGFYGTYRLTEYLLERGHKKIAYVGTLHATQSITDRYLGYVKALLEHGMEIRKEYLIEDRNMVSGLRDDYSDYKLPEDMPDAFVCNCDFIAGILIRMLKERGIRVPEDVSVVGFDHFLNPALCDVELTTYAVDIPGMAKQAVDAVICRIRDGKEPAGIHIVEGYLYEGESVRPRN